MEYITKTYIISSLIYLTLMAIYLYMTNKDDVIALSLYATSAFLIISAYFAHLYSKNEVIPVCVVFVGIICMWIFFFKNEYKIKQQNVNYDTMNTGVLALNIICGFVLLPTMISYSIPMIQNMSETNNNVD